MLNRFFETATAVLQKLARNFKIMEPVPARVPVQQDYHRRRILANLQNRLNNGDISATEYIRLVERLRI